MFSSILYSKFPFREGNSIRFLIDGHQFYPSMLKAISCTEKSLLMEMYLFESGNISDQFIRAFSTASQRGVTVRLLIDAYGGRGLLKSDRDKLEKAGVELAFYNPLYFKNYRNNLFRTHRKYLIIDNKAVFVGGAGITDDFDGENAWRETVVKVQGPVVKDWIQLFIYSFKNWSKTLDSSADYFNESNNEEYKGNVRARVSYTRGGVDLEIKKVLLSRMAHSKKSVWLASAYFVPSRKIRQALRKAAINNIDVRLLLPGEITDHPAVRCASRRYYARLLRFGVRIFEYQGRFTHTKMVLIDDWLTIGSSNMDRWNFRWNMEANQEIDDKDTSQQARNIMCNDFKNCHEILYHEWARRSRMQRMKEWLWGKVDIWISKL